MSSHTSFLPLSSPSDSPKVLLPRRPSLEPDRDILTTRGQRILTFLPSRTSSPALQDPSEESIPPGSVRRGPLLIGHKNARYEWCVARAKLPVNVPYLTASMRPGNATIGRPSH
jgi:hypothetical protein